MFQSITFSNTVAMYVLCDKRVFIRFLVYREQIQELQTSLYSYHTAHAIVSCRYYHYYCYFFSPLATPHPFRTRPPCSLHSETCSNSAPTVQWLLGALVKRLRFGGNLLSLNKCLPNLLLVIFYRSLGKYNLTCTGKHYNITQPIQYNGCDGQTGSDWYISIVIRRDCCAE